MFGYQNQWFVRPWNITPECPHFDAGWPLVASTMRLKLCFFGMCLGQGPMLQRYNRLMFWLLPSVCQSFFGDWWLQLTEYNRNTSTEIRDEAFGLRTTPSIKCYIVVCSQANPWIRNDWTSAHKCAGRCICYSFKVLKKNGIILDCSPNAPTVSACVLHAKVMVQWYLETECFRQPDPASVSQDLEPFEGVQSHVLYADSPVLFLAHANLRHHLNLYFVRTISYHIFM